MIFHPPILALVLVSTLSAALMLWASVFALQLLRRWDLASGSEIQIALEKRTYLVSTVLGFVMALELAALVLFAFNADRMAVMFVGAMCAVGTLNASPFGFPALFAKLGLFFASALWLVVNHADGKGRDYPLTRFKYGLLVAFAPLALLEATLSLSYFLDLKADTVTSCCGKLFAPEKASLGGEMAGLDPKLALILLFGGLAATILSGFVAARRGRGLPLFGAASAGFFAVAIAAIVSVISLYVYEHPHHHCPFCLLKREYGYIGFALYIPLFAGTALGLSAGVLGALRTPDSLAAVMPELTRRLVVVASLCFLLFGGLSALAIARSNLVLL